MRAPALERHSATIYYYFYFHPYYCYLLLQERHAASIAELQEQLREKKDASRELMTELQRDKDASKELMVLNLHSIY